MTQIGRIISVKDDKATVLIMRATACGESCASCGGCQQTRQTVIALNTVGANVGSMVLIELSDNKVLLAAFLVYIVPILLLVVGFAVFGYLFGAVAFILAFAILYFLDKRLSLRYTANVTKAWRNTD